MPASPSARSPGWHPLSLLLILSLWLTLPGNLPFWLALWRLPEHEGWRVAAPLLTWLGVVWGGTMLLLALTAWRWWLKPWGLFLILAAAAASYFMASYGIVIDSSMIANVAHTDWRETLDLLSWPMVAALVAGVLLPGAWWWRQPVRCVPAGRLVLQQLGLGLLGVMVAAGALWLGFEDAATLMRNHKPLRYMLNPHNTLYAGAQLAFKEGLGAAAQADAPLITVAPDARLHTPVTDPDQAPLIVLVVGETVRAANVGLQGYARDTTPGLRALKAQGPGTLVYFDQVRSCGTNTHTSLPCLFSIQGQDGVGQESRHENLLDVLQRAGLAVVWLDNQSGCKGVCARVPTVNLRDENDPRCPDGECPDDVLLERLPKAVASLDPARRARGTVVVMHQMGSHGPAYHRRSTPALKAFQPECTDASLPQCSAQSIVNAYDNSIRQTDQLLSRTITWLSQQTRPTALLYVSDHGESLGENGLYLHGMPYSLAPPEQTHVPMLTWVSDPLAQSRGWGRDCLGARAHEALSHDHVFGTVLTLSGVRTQAVPADRHALSACR